MTAHKRRWIVVSLVTSLALVTVCGVWIGYYIHWKNQRREARAWIEAEGIGGSIGYHPEARPGLPWMLGLLGEKAETYLVMAHVPTQGSRERAPAEYRCLAEKVTRLFPEAQVIDLSDFEVQARQDQTPERRERFDKAIRRAAEIAGEIEGIFERQEGSREFDRISALTLELHNLLMEVDDIVPPDEKP